MDSKRLYGSIYALVEYWDDALDDETILYIFYKKDEYEKTQDMWNEEQEYTGCGWRTIWKRQ